jgi:dTDP-4-dehydrorhamnose 3,5-epimerase
VRFTPVAIEGAFLVETRSFEDERGSFSSDFDAEAFAARGLCRTWSLWSRATSRTRGLLRGLHFQAAPYEETKLVRCARGAIFDVVVDLRPESRSYRRWASVTLEAAGGRSLYVPAGCAHGYQTLADDVEVHYLISAPYHAALQRGLRWDDPTLKIGWPLPELVRTSPRDAALPFLEALA